MIIEACCENIEEAILAEKRGATRIEFCSNLKEDGLSPKSSDVETLLQSISIPVRIMVRPTNTFFPTEAEIETMIESIIDYNTTSIEGYVIGMLNSQNRVDFPALERILSFVGKTKSVCFHKAIDYSVNISSDIMHLNAYKTIDTILTSGGYPTAWKGRFQILEMQSAFERTIMAAGKITRENLTIHQEFLNLNAYHGRKIV